MLLIVLMAAFGAKQAGAYSLEIQPNGVVDVAGVDPFFFNIVFNPDPSDVSLDDYQFNVFYDAVEIDWDLSLSTFTSPSPLVPQMFGDPTETTNGRIDGIAGFVCFFSGCGSANIAGSGPITLATLAFHANVGINNPVPDGSPDVWFDISSTGSGTGTGFFTDSGFTAMSSVAINGTGSDVVVTPEPVSSALFLVGGATLGFRRFRKKFKK